MDDNAINDPQTYAIIGAAMEVHAVLGCGFLESVYHEALCKELSWRGIPYESEVLLPIHYKGERLNKTYKADLLCHGNIVVELKALQKLTGSDEAQLINYLKASGTQRGLLFNFGNERLQYRRRVMNYEG